MHTNSSSSDSGASDEGLKINYSIFCINYFSKITVKKLDKPFEGSRLILTVDQFDPMRHPN